MKYLYKFIIVLFGLITITSCEDEPKLQSDFNYLTFDATSDITVDQNSTTEQNVIIYSSQLSSNERTIELEIDINATSADEAAYSVPSTVKIPANSNKGEFTINITDVNIGDSGESLVIKLVKSDGLFTGDDLSLRIYRFCPLDINTFIGDYTITEEGYGDYDTVITLDPTVPNRIWVSNFWDWAVELAYYDFNPEDGTVIMPSQSIEMGDGSIYSCAGSGTYNACNGTFHMEYQGDVAGTVHDFTPKP